MKKMKAFLKKTRRRAVIAEAIERRALLSGSPAVFDGSTLTVTGPGTLSTIAVNYSGTTVFSPNRTLSYDVTVTVNRQVQTFAGIPMQGLIVDGGNGGNAITVKGDESNGGPTDSISTAITINGGSGNDTISTSTTANAGAYTPDTLVINTGDGTDSVTAFLTGNTTITGGSGNDTFYVGDTSTGSANFTQATVYGGSGNDLIATDSEGVNLTAYGQDGNDTIQDQFEQDTLVASGGAGTDTFNFGAQTYYPENEDSQPIAITLDGQTHDNVSLNSDIENVTDTDALVYNSYVVTGNASNNVLDVYSNGGVTLNGMGGNDVLNAGKSVGPNALYGGDGNDTLVGGTGTTYYFGGAGNDTIDLSADTGSDTVNLNPGIPGVISPGGQTATAYFDGTVETVIGGSGNDLIVGTSGNNVLQGNGGNDTLIGGGGTDALFGGDGNDNLTATGGTSDYIDAGNDVDTVYTGTGDTVVNAESTNPGSTKMTGTLVATAGSFQNDGNTASKAIDGNTSTFFDAPTANGNFVGLDLGSAKSIGSISFAPRADWAQRMVGGIFQASNSASFSSTVTLYTITTVPQVGVLTTVSTSTTSAYRYVRYLAPGGSYGDVAEVQFFGPAAAPPTGTLTVNLFSDINGNGKLDSGGSGLAGFGTYLDLNDDGVYDGSDIRVLANTSGGIAFGSLPIGEYILRQNVPTGYAVTTPVTGFPVPVYIAAGTNGVVTIGEKPDVNRLTGTVIGTAGSFSNSGNTIAKALDGNLSTYFDAPTASGAWVGIDLGSTRVVTQVRVAPRAGWESRMVGGTIEASDTADFSSGTVTLATITATPPAGVLTTLSLNSTTAYRYYRYIGPDGGYCDIAELEFDG